MLSNQLHGYLLCCIIITILHLVPLRRLLLVDAKISSNQPKDANWLYTAGSKNDIYLSEFEILDMSGHDGRLQNGYCCNGQRPATTQTPCKGGNTTCLPYWRVCIVEMTPDMTGPVFASREVGGSGGGTGGLLSEGVSSAATTKKPSMISHFFTKILSMYGYRPSGDRAASKHLKEILDHMSPSTCRIGFWTSDVIMAETQFPLKLRKPIIWNSPPSAKGKGGVTATNFDRNVMCIVEIWSKNPRVDVKNRLIARQIQHYSVFIDPDTTITSDWFYGGKTLESPMPPATSGPNGAALFEGGSNSLNPNRRNDKLSSKQSGFGHRYLSYPPPKPHPFNTWISPALISVPSRSKPVFPFTTKPRAPTPREQPPPLPSSQPPHLHSVFKYKFRWHVKALHRKSLISRDGSANSLSSETNATTQPLPSPVFGYNDEEDDLASLNLTMEGCPQGYQGADCSVPVCLEGCDHDHGYCEQPGQCLCRFGWTGLFCNYCLTLPGCVHGYCNRPLECRCEEGWTGVFCSTPKCKDGCNTTNGYCTVPGECKCKFGWQGENCTECATLPGCQHGTCNDPLDCLCEPGWQGTFCSSPICAPDCTNGWCKRPNECRCKVGFKGDNCAECVAYPGCDHGTCAGNGTKPWTCECEAGWGGFTCSEQLNWCESRNATRANTAENPCQNGGTCVSIESANGSYLCQCLLGYTGRHCEKIAP